MKSTINAIAAGLIGLAAVNIIFFSPRTPAVVNSVFGGATGLFGTLTSNRAGG